MDTGGGRRTPPRAHSNLKLLLRYDAIDLPMYSTEVCSQTAFAASDPAGLKPRPPIGLVNALAAKSGID
jgi:hypothetical protein